MKAETGTHQRYIETPLAFRLFKYAVYCLLAWDVAMFFMEDILAAHETFGDTITWRNVVNAFTATVDTAAWVILLLIFELETAVIPDDRLQGALKWLLAAVRAACYFFIVWAAWGYVAKYLTVSSLEPFAGDVCGLVGAGFTWVSTLDEYLPLDAASCAVLQGGDLYRISGTDIIGTPVAIRAAIDLAIVDIINATDWLLIVVMLEVEVWLQLRDRLSGPLIRVFKALKTVLYGILFAAALYWLVYGDFLDFWDAFLWLVAFIFIELNIFQWHAEVEEEKAHQGAGPPHA